MDVSQLQLGQLTFPGLILVSILDHTPHLRLANQIPSQLVNNISLILLYLAMHLFQMLPQVLSLNSSTSADPSYEAGEGARKK